MNFEQRKRKGNVAERAFELCYPQAIRTSSFDWDDFTTTTADMEPIDKYKPDYKLHGDFVEVKSSIFYNQAEYDHHMAVYGMDMKVFVFMNGVGRLYNILDLHIIGPYKGNNRGSGLPYYKMRI